MAFKGFEKVEFVSAFYDDYIGTVFYHFETTPQIGHGEWSISCSGDVMYDMISDNCIQGGDYPPELIHLVEYITDDMPIDGLPDDWD